jgi:hypothetical protein
MGDNPFAPEDEGWGVRHLRNAHRALIEFVLDQRLQRSTGIMAASGATGSSVPLAPTLTRVGDLQGATFILDNCGAIG